MVSRRIVLLLCSTLFLGGCSGLFSETVRGRAAPDRAAVSARPLAPTLPQYPQPQEVRVEDKPLAAQHGQALRVTPLDVELSEMRDIVSAPGVTSTLEGKTMIGITVRVELLSGAPAVDSAFFAALDDQGRKLDGFVSIDLDAHRTSFTYQKLEVGEPVDIFLTYTMEPGRRFAMLLAHPSPADLPNPKPRPGLGLWKIPKQIGTSGEPKHFVGCLNDSRTKHTTVTIIKSGPVWGYNPDCDAKAAASPPSTDGDVFVGCPKGEYAQPGVGVYYDADGRLRLRENDTCLR